MRTLPSELQAALDSGATRLARCWKVVRSDGSALGFTDHDRSLFFDGIDFEPESGFSPSAVESGTGLAPDTHEVAGALSSERITEADIKRGLYDRAEVTLHLVDWTDPSVRVVLSRGLIGEIRHGSLAFEAEVTGLSDLLSQPIGRAFVHSCPCRLGDAKCGVDLSAPEHEGAGSVAAVAGSQRFEATGLSGFADGWFSGGVLEWTAGANAGAEGHVKIHLLAGQRAVIELWLSPAFPISPGDTFRVSAGCEKTAGICGAKFGNLVNFRGFPHMPGDDAAASYPSNGGRHDGGSLFRS